MEVIGIPLPKPGFYIVELASPRLGRALHGEDKPYYVSTSVLVTNLAVHLKHGRESSLVWVTSLDRGKPVAGARVTVRDCTGKLWFEGKTDADGIATADDKLPPPGDVPQCKGDYRRALIAFARAGRRPLVHVLGLERGHTAVEFQSAHGELPPRARSRSTPCSTARCSAPARR